MIVGWFTAEVSRWAVSFNFFLTDPSVVVDTTSGRSVSSYVITWPNTTHHTHYQVVCVDGSPWMKLFLQCTLTKRFVRLQRVEEQQDQCGKQDRVKI